MEQPTIVYWSWRRAWPQFVAIAALIALFWVGLPPRAEHLALIIGPFIYLTYSIMSRRLITRAHRRGMKAAARKDYDAAIPLFNQSYLFFSKHRWLDDYRAITMMSPSNWSYRELALLNIAAAHAEKGDVAEAKRCYECVVREFPGNEYAGSALRFIAAASHAPET